MTRKNITLEKLAKEAEPYDPSVAKVGYLLKFVEGNAELEEQFQKELTNEFLKSIQEVGKCYFVINNESYKAKKKIDKKIRLGYCGKERVPLISLDI